LSHITQLVRAGLPLSSRGGRFVKRTMVGISVAVVFFGAAAVPTGLVAGADQLGATRDQVRSLQSQVASGAQQIRQLTLVYNQESFRATNLAQQVTADQADLSQLQGQVSSSRAVLREDAIISYMGGDAETGPVSPSGISDPSIRAEYLDMAAGAITDAVDQYRTQERQLVAAEAVLTRQEESAQDAAIATAAARTQVLSAASREQQQLDALQARLSQLETTAALADAAARPAPATQGLPVNNGMVAAIQTVVAPTPAPSPAATPSQGSSQGGMGGVWLQLRECESGDNYQANTGNGFYGAYQFSEATWQNLGYPGRPDLEPPALQDQAAVRLQAQAGWGQWPACAAALGL
jgi:resuscitation-promoting factor RpfB